MRISRGRLTFISELIALTVIAFAASPALGQGRAQVMMWGKPDGTHEVLRLTLPDYKVLRTPDFTARDLPLMTRTLVLSQEQVNLAGALIEKHLEQFRALTKKFAAQMDENDAEYVPELEALQPADARPEDDVSESMNIEEFKLDLPPTSNVQVGHSIHRAAPDPNTPPPPPEVKVEVTIDSPEGEEIPQKIIDKIRERADQVAARMVERLAAEDAAKHAGQPAAKPRFDIDSGYEALKAQHEEMMAQVEDFIQSKQRLRAQFVSEMLAVLAEVQSQRWPVFERAIYRERHLPEGELPGESIDLVKVIDEMKLRDEQLQSIGETLESYEITLDSALRQRDGYIATSEGKIDEAIVRRKPDAALTIVDRVSALRVAVRGVNQQHMTRIAAALGPELGETFRVTALKACYPNIYVTTRGRKMFAEVRKMSDLDEQTRRSILELETAYEAELANVNEQIRATTDREKPLEGREHIEALKNSMEGQPWGNGRQNPIRGMILKRAALDDRYLELVSQLLGEERAVTLPKPRKNREPIQIESGSN